jgi:hypothetical protein
MEVLKRKTFQPNGESVWNRWLLEEEWSGPKWGTRKLFQNFLRLEIGRSPITTTFQPSGRWAGNPTDKS